MVLPFPLRSTWINAKSSALCADVPQLRDWVHTVLSKVAQQPAIPDSILNKTAPTGIEYLFGFLQGDVCLFGSGGLEHLSHSHAIMKGLFWVIIRRQAGWVGGSSFKELDTRIVYKKCLIMHYLGIGHSPLRGLPQECSTECGVVWNNSS